jgi:hypothetical protein
MAQAPKGAEVRYFRRVVFFPRRSCLPPAKRSMVSRAAASVSRVFGRSFARDHPHKWYKKEGITMIALIGVCNLLRQLPSREAD